MELDDIVLPSIDPEQAIQEIGDFVIDRVKNVRTTGCVIGLSGGVDSTVAASIIKTAFDNYNANHEDNLELVGYILPSGTNTSTDTQDGIRVAEQLGVRYEVQNIEGIIQAYENTNPEALDNKFHRGNLSSRVRANVLNTKAATEGKIVSGTGNKDEDYNLGYYTMFGDGAVHINPLGNLPKRLVAQLAHYFNFSEIAGKEPTAGLEKDQTDFKDLGYLYGTSEVVIRGKDQGFTPEQLARKKNVTRLITEDSNTYEALFGEKKFSGVPEAIADILHRHTMATSKAEVISPPIAPVTVAYDVLVDENYEVIA